uniref:Putative reverse transcriptase n=1 Tax=Ixodes ricinus TaxID=34613 RepID=A0A0K8RJV8_IXORI
MVSRFLFCPIYIFYSNGNVKSSYFARNRGLPQGLMLSPLLFHILLSSIATSVYTDDIVVVFLRLMFIHKHYIKKLQAYQELIFGLLSGVNLIINATKCEVNFLAFPIRFDVTTELGLRISQRSILPV